MAQRFKSKNAGAVIPLLLDDLVIAGGTLRALSGGGFHYTRTRIERSGYAERADYYYILPEMQFEHTEVFLSEDAIQQITKVLANLASHCFSFQPVEDPNDTVRSLWLWANGQKVELIVPVEFDASAEAELLSSFNHAWRTIHALIPRSPKFV